MLFNWPKEQLAGDRILDLVINGPQQVATIEPTVERHWEDFMNRAFLMLGPRRFDEINALTQELNQVILRSKLHISS